MSIAPVACAYRHTLPLHRRWFALTKLDGAFLPLYYYFKAQGVQGVWLAWPRPSLEACAILAAFGTFEAALQLLLPGKTVKGPVTPNGNVPIYKVRHRAPAAQPACIAVQCQQINT